jgi:hypothetical protein
LKTINDLRCWAGRPCSRKSHSEISRSPTPDRKKTPKNKAVWWARSLAPSSPPFRRRAALDARPFRSGWLEDRADIRRWQEAAERRRGRSRPQHLPRCGRRAALRGRRPARYAQRLRRQAGAGCSVMSPARTGRRMFESSEAHVDPTATTRAGGFSRCSVHTVGPS